MRHSGRTFRPPGPAFPPGILPDLWGFGSSRELPPVPPAVRRRLRLDAPSPRPPLRLAAAGPDGRSRGGAPGAGGDPIAGLLRRLTRLFG
jgi:hypothetical protein